MTRQLNVYEIKTQFSKILDLVENGETVIVCKRNVPVAEIRPIARKQKKTPQLGWAKGRIEIQPSFNEPLSEEELVLWEEGHELDPMRTFLAKPSKKATKKK